MYTELSLSNISDEELHELFHGAQISALLGSAISIWEPTSLFSGEEFGRSLYELIFFDKNGNQTEQSLDRNVLFPLYQKLPFEVINDQCPNKLKIQETLCNLYNRSTYNPIHKLFVELLREKTISSIITTNYDLCLDNAINMLNQISNGEADKTIIRVVTESDFSCILNREASIYFKIHGSVDLVSSIPLIYSLQQEGLLDVWKQKLLHQLIRKKILFIVGYSGKDFDICQEIPYASPYKVIWNFPDRESISSNAQRLKGKCDLIIIIGDMRDLLTRLYRLTNASRVQSELKIAEEFRQRFSEIEIDIWQLKILTKLNYNLPAIKLAERLLHHEKVPIEWHIEILGEQASALGSNGQYRSAAINHLTAARLAHRKLKNHQKYIQQINAASDAFRGFGDILQSVYLHLKNISYQKKFRTEIFRSDFTHEAINILAQNEVFILQEVYRIMKKIHLRVLEDFIRHLAEEKLKELKNSIQESGNIYLFQQLQAWEIRFDILSDTTLNRRIYSPTPEEGYQQLFFPMGFMMEFRYRVNKHDGKLNTDILTRTYELLRLARALGIRPEIWKLLHLIKSRFPSNFTKADLWELNFEFSNCQYSFLQRMEKRLFGS